MRLFTIQKNHMRLHNPENLPEANYQRECSYLKRADHHGNKMKKTLLFIGFSLTTYLLCVVQALISMLAYQKEPSSACWGCSLSYECLRYSLIVFVIFILYLVMINFFRMNKQIKITGFSALYLFCMFFVDSSIFVNRVASWSTYDATEIVIAVLSKCLPAMLISCCVFVLIVILVKSETFK